MAQGILGAGYARQRSGPGVVRFRFRARALAAARAIQRFLGPGPHHVVDFGAAEGRGLGELARLLPGSTFLGVEASDDLISSATSLPPGARLVAGDVQSLPESIAAGSADVVTALALLEHLPEPARAVREAARVLRPGGLFLATCPNGTWDRIASKLGLLADDQHEHRLGRKELRELATNNGLEVVVYRRFMWAPVGFLPYLRIAVPPRLAFGIDRLVARVRVLDWLFVNQLLGARRPGPTTGEPVG